MTTIVLEPPAALINANDRLHHHAKAKLTKAWRKAAEEAVNSGWHPEYYKRAHIVCAVRFPTNHRRDVGNYFPTAKAIVDGIVDAQLLIFDDSDKYVTGPDMRRDRPNGPLRITITITETGASVNPDVRPACLNQPLLFEAEDLASHQTAKALCDTCPAVTACRQLLKDTIKDYGYGPQLGPRGTWAGRLLAPDYKDREAAA